MNRRRILVVLLMCMFLLLSAQTALAETSGGAWRDPSGTDITAGVMIDYMGKMRFTIVDADTGEPIPGASIEIYIATLDRYVLVGVTDANGNLEMDVAYGGRKNMTHGEDGKPVFSGSLDRIDQFAYNSGQFMLTQSPLFLTDNTITYRVYKAQWLPYPHSGKMTLDIKQIPYEIPVRLFRLTKDNKPSNVGGPNGGGTIGTGQVMTMTMMPLITPFPGEVTIEEAMQEGIETGQIPKTGVEGTMWYWIIAAVFFVAAGLIIIYLMRAENDKEKKREFSQESVN